MDKVAFIHSTIRPMAEFTFPYVGSIAGVVDHDTGEFVGSAVRLRLGGRPALATALHVMEAANARGGCAFSSGPDQPLHVLRGAIHYERIGDVAVHVLQPGYAPPGVRFWPEDRIERSDQSVSSDFLFVHGFPGSQTRFLRLLDNSLFATSLPYGAMQRVEEVNGPLAAHQFAISFNPTSMRRADTGAAFFVDPGGLSGSPVWRIGVTGQPAVLWTPESSRLVGIVTHWDQQDGVLIATRAHRLLEIRLP